MSRKRGLMAPSFYKIDSVIYSNFESYFKLKPCLSTNIFHVTNFVNKLFK